jgi:hypothetical protein
MCPHLGVFIFMFADPFLNFVDSTEGLIGGIICLWFMHVIVYVYVYFPYFTGHFFVVSYYLFLMFTLSTRNLFKQLQ